MSKYLAFVMVLIGAALVSCAKTSSNETTIPANRQAPAAIQASFQQINNPTCGNVPCLQIKKASLGKLFIMISSGKSGGPAPQWLDTKPQVVSFEKAFGQLALMEENYSTVYEEIHAKNLLKSFDILFEDDNVIVFNWGKGLSSLTTEGVFDIDGPGEEKDDGEGFASILPVQDSFVRRVSFDDNNLYINQVSRVRMPAQKGTAEKPEMQMREASLDMDLQIRAYLPSAKFLVKEADLDRRVGFFVTKLKTKTLSSTDRNIIAKWDISEERGPIRILISNTTPEEYVGAASEAALYWNKVFGREVVAVETHVDPQSAPQERSIMVHWVPWMDAGFAYAQAQADPLTGEILRGRVFMTSVFTRPRIADLVTSTHNKPVLGKAVACDFTQKVASDLENVDSMDAALKLRRAQDSVRVTIAHELGHALGLRHNFAASFSAKVSTGEVLEKAKEYRTDPNHPGLETATSVMDYIGGIDEMLSAGFIKHSASSYDAMAMTWAYAENDSALDEKVSLFCTDEDIDLNTEKGILVYGCERFDAGSNPMQRRLLDAVENKNFYAKILFHDILNRRFPADEGARKITLDRAILETNAAGYLRLGTTKLISTMLLVTKKEEKIVSRYISIANAKATIGKTPEAEDKAVEEKILSDLKEAGGYASFFEKILFDSEGQYDSKWLEKQIAELKTLPEFKTGATVAGQAYSLSDEDQAKLIKYFTTLEAKTKKATFTAVAALIPQKNEKAQTDSVLKDKVVAEGEETRLIAIAKKLMTHSDGVVKAQVGEKLAQSIELPKRVLSVAERKLAYNLVTPDRLAIGANRGGIQAVKASLKSQIDSVYLAADKDAAVSDTTLEDYKKILPDLQKSVQVDAAAATWLEVELGLL